MLSPLTDSQHAMWLLHTISGRGQLFNVAECIAFNGKVSVSFLQQALEHVWHSTDTLSNRYVHDELYQPHVQAHHNCPTISVEYLQTTPKDIVSFSQHWLSDKLSSSFDLSNDTLIQFYLLRAPEQDYLVIVAHHLILDGYGFGLFMQSFSQSYTAIAKQQALPQLNLGQHSTLIEYYSSDRFQSKKANAKNALNSWLDKAPEAFSFSQSKADINHINSRQSHSFESIAWNTICSAAKHIKTSPSEIIIAAIAASLVAEHAVYDVNIGFVMMNRQHLSELNTLCVQSNVLPLILSLKPEFNLENTTALINSQIKALKKVQCYRVESLKRDRQKLGKSQNIIGPTVNLLPFASSPKFAHLSTTSHVISAGTTDDMMLQVHLLADAPANIDFDANIARYDTKLVSRIANNIKYAATSWSQNPHITLNTLCNDIREI